MEIHINAWGNNWSEVMGVWELEVGNQYAEKVCDELSSVLNLSNKDVKIRKNKEFYVKLWYHKSSSL